MLHYLLRLGCLSALWLLAAYIGFAQAPQLSVNAEQLKSLQLIEQRAVATRDSLLLAETYCRYGDLYHAAADNLISKRYYLKAILILEPRGDSFKLGWAYIQLAATLNVRSDSQEDIWYANRALDVFKRIHSPRGIAKAYAILGGMYHWRWAGLVKNEPAKRDSILFCYRQIEQIGAQLRDTAIMAEGKARLATLFINLKDRRAIKNLQWVLAWYNRKGSDTARIHIMADLAQAHLEFSELKASGRLVRQARQLYDDRRYEDYGMLSHLSYVAMLHHRRTGQWKQAFDNLATSYYFVREQLHTKRDGFAAWFIEASEVEKKEVLLRAQQRELLLETERRQAQERFTWAASALFVVAGGISLIFYQLNQKNQRISRQNEELVKEQNHRVKNNLQTVSNLLSLQAKRLSDKTARQAVEESRLRIESIAILHRRLYDGAVLAAVELEEFVQAVTGEVLNTFGFAWLPVQYDLAFVTLTADKATPLGLILNELVTNACKYAFPDQDCPSLRISCYRAGPKLIVEVGDNGPGFDATAVQLVQTDELLPPRNRSFGMALIQAQVAQLNGTGKFSEEPGGGTRFRLTFSL